MSTRQQRWAKNAIEKINHVKNGKEEDGKEYASFCKKFPSMIHSCGLCQALAFAQSKKPDYVQDLQYVLGDSELLEKSRESDTSEYQRLTRNALDAATWLKRYAEALLKGD